MTDQLPEFSDADIIDASVYALDGVIDTLASVTDHSEVRRAVIVVRAVAAGLVVLRERRTAEHLDVIAMQAVRDGLLPLEEFEEVLAKQTLRAQGVELTPERIAEKVSELRTAASLVAPRPVDGQQ